MKRYLALLFAILFSAPVALAQSSGGCKADPLSLADAASTQQPAPSPNERSDTLTEAEKRVRDIIAQDGVHVVHFWAPWCPNSKNELKNGWYEVVEQYEGVSFTFVTIWNDGESGAKTLDRYAIPDRVLELTQPDRGPSEEEANRRKEFLDLPVTWIPTTWVFHNNGELAFAMNYGEMDMKTLSHLINMTQKDW